jgi:hypothetical protein
VQSGFKILEVEGGGGVSGKTVRKQCPGTKVY